jgi:PilZ domain-containing protein
MRERRRHVRVKGPFDGCRVGALDTAVEIYDLSEGGCFVNSLNEPPEIGRRLKLRIDLPGQPGVIVDAETCYARPGGYAVRFENLSDETRRQLRETLERLQGGNPDEETSNLI